MLHHLNVAFEVMCHINFVFKVLHLLNVAFEVMYHLNVVF